MHKTLYHVKHIPSLSSAFSGCISVSAFPSTVQIPLGITSSEIVLKICAMTAESKKYKSIIKKKEKKKHNKILLLANSKLNVIEVLMSKALIDLYIRHKEFVSINVLKENKKKKQQNKLKS